MAAMKKRFIHVTWKRAVVFGLILLLGLAACIFVYHKVTQISAEMVEYVNMQGEGPECITPSLPISDDSVIEQDFSTAALFTELSFFVTSSGNESCTITAQLYDSDSGELLGSDAQTLGGISSYSELFFSLPGTAQNGNYHLRLAFSEVSGAVFLGKLQENNHLGLYKQNGAARGGELYLNMVLPHVTTSVRLMILLMLVGMLTLAVVTGLILFCSTRLEYVYVVCALGVGAVLFFVQPAMLGFDMRFHFDSTYALSNEMLGYGGSTTVEQTDPETGAVETVEMIWYRDCDLAIKELSVSLGEPLGDNYSAIRRGLQLPYAFPSAEEREVHLQPVSGSLAGEPYIYLPQAVGFTIARLAGLSSAYLFSFGRIFSYLFFVLCMAVSIRIVPIGKHLFFVVGMVPVALIQTMSMSYDGNMISISVFLIAKVIQLAYTDKKITVWQWILVLVPSLLMTPLKMIYYFMGLLWLLILKNRSNDIFKRPSRKKLVLTTVAGAAGITGFFLFMQMKTLFGLTAVEKSSVYGGSSYTLSYFLQHPGHGITIIFNTLRSNIGEYITNAVSPFEIDLGQTIGIPLLVLLLVFLAVNMDREPECRDIRRIGLLDRLYVVFLVVCMFGLSLLAAYQWTPVGYDYIRGVQGRYFTLMIPMLCILLYQNPWFRSTKRCALFVKLGTVAVPCILLTNMYLWVLQQTANFYLHP